MRRATGCLILTLIFPIFLYAQHSSGNSSNNNSSSSSGSSSNPSSGSSGYSGGNSEGSHSSGNSSSASSTTSSNSGGSWHSSSSSSSSGGGGHSGSTSTSSASHSNSSRVSSESHASLRNETRGGEVRVSERPVHGLNEPGKKSARGVSTSGPISEQQKKPEQKGTIRHRLFSLFRRPPPCRGKNCVTQPPCRSKDCKPTCPPGQIANGSSCVSALYIDRDVCTSGYDPTGRCTSTQLVAPCTAPSPALLAAAEQEVERLRRQRDVACSQNPVGQSCSDLTRSYNDAVLRLEELRSEVARCRTP